MARLKIAVLYRDYPLPHLMGCHTYLRDMMRYLQASDFEVEFVQLDGRPYYRLPKEEPPFDRSVHRNYVRWGRYLLKTRLVDWLLRVPHVVYQTVPDTYRPFVWRLAKRCGYERAPWNNLATQEEKAFTRERIESFRPDVLLVNYFHLASVFDILPADSPIVKAVVTHDVWKQRVASFKDGGVFMEGDLDFEVEREQLRKADILLAISDEDAVQLKEIAPECDIVHAPMSAPGHRPRTNPVPGRLLFVGSDARQNRVGMKWFLEEVWPIVREKNPNAHLRIVGGICREIHGRFPNVRKLGRIADLAPEYDAAQLAIAPLLVGSGLKIKVVETLGYSVPCVTTPIGAQGFGETVGKSILVATTPAEFAEGVLSILADPVLRQRMSAAASEYVERRLSPRAAYQPFVDSIRKRVQHRSVVMAGS